MKPTFYYQEITCLPDHEISVGFVMGKVMDALHLGLVNLAAGSLQCPIGLSFPEYRDRVATADDKEPGDDSSQVPRSPPIGSKIRLFSRQEEDLQRLGLSGQLERFSDYVHWTSLRLLERKVSKYATYDRRQPKSSRERLVRRQMKRKGLSESEARELYATFEPRDPRLPYLNMRSHSTGQRFRLYVERQLAEEADAWCFSTYGLSRSSSVPEF